MPQGNVRWFDKKKGYGFVAHEGKDVFIHYSAFEGDFILETNDLITFEVINGEKGLKAEKINKNKKGN